MRSVDVLPGIYGVGLVCMMCNRQSRRLGDFVAGTVVVHEKPTEEVRPIVEYRERTKLHFGGNRAGNCRRARPDRDVLEPSL